ncbi:ABC transporter permease [Rhodococcus hoagii]|nr:ABC transporter permease [Prescottella equi]NKR72298.1 ABC transporter permease [Prescottella equi]NKS16212.1 ABC transporter permease [Prescottella equi]NKS22978.1 ABC transporter permease [Prescottella equi]
MWWAAALAALTITVWVATTWSMADISMSCAKIGESGSSFGCDDSIVDVLGVWPLVGLGLLLATPSVVAALAMRKWCSWLMVAALAGVSIAGLVNWSSFWGSLLFAVPLSVLGWVATVLQRGAGPNATVSDGRSIRSRNRRPRSP